MSASSLPRIVGEWLEKDGKVVGNQECRVIDHLISDHLIRVGSRDGGWTGLFRDPTDDTLWELT
jgi:Immunity protein 27